MALDVYKSKNGTYQELLLSIDDGGYAILSTAFDIYKKRTGLFIDPYATLKLNSGVAPLISSINDAFPDNKHKIVNTLLDILKQAESEHFGVTFVGD